MQGLNSSAHKESLTTDYTDENGFSFSQLSAINYEPLRIRPKSHPAISHAYVNFAAGGKPMTLKKFVSTVVIIFAVVATVLVFTSCAEMEATNTKSLLTSAGFHTVTPTTPLQK